MSNQKQFMKSKLRLRGLTTLAVLLFSMQLTIVYAIETTKTTAPVKITPALESTSIENKLKVLRQSTTPATLQLTKQQNDEEFEIKHQLSKTSKQISSTAELIHTTSSFAPSTFASSNVPATTTSEAKPATAKKAQDEMKKLISTTKNFENNNEWGSKIIEIDTEQVTKSVGEKQQQGTEPITTEVSWQKETDMQQQSTGNSRNSKIDMKFAATKAMPTQAQMPLFSTTTHPLTIKKNTAKGPKSPSEQTKVAQFKQKEIVSDEIKPTKEEIPEVTLSLEEDKQALEDFKPLIKDANEKLLKERTIFTSKPKSSNEDWKQNLMPNELEYDNNKPLLSRNYEHNINWRPYLHPATPVTDFTGKLLQEQDGVITEIEQKFRLNEFSHDGDSDNIKFSSNSDSTTSKTSLELTQTTTFSKDPQPASSTYPVNHKTVNINKSKSPVEFIERRVKKSFDFPMHRVASDAQHMQQHFDFANTKFNSNNNEQHNLQELKISTEGQQQENTQQTRPQPEFSTTKFYNSKELYNEMLQHKTKQQQQQQTPSNAANFHDKHMEELNNRAAPSLSLNSFAVLHSPKIAKLEEVHETKDIQQQQKQKSLAIKKVTVKATKHNKDASFNTEDSATTATTTDTTTTTANAKSIETTLTLDSTPIKGLSTNTLTEMPLAALVKTKKFQKELKRAKLLIKSMLPLQTAPETTISNRNNNNNNNNSELKGFRQQNTTTNLAQPTQTPLETKIISQTTVSLQTLPYTAATTTAASASPILVLAEEHFPASAVIPLASSTSSPKTSSHPILRPRILSRLQEKINSLECELQNLPQDSHLWRGNETHELLLPIMICKPYWTPTSWFANNRWVIRNSRNCSATTDTPENCKNDKDCTAMMVSWEGESEIQSGDILIVEINDALLTPKDINLTTSAHNTQVYQVTRSGHEHCDATEGILLDITPLIVDGRKLVTLYDKDLTEGVNLLIVVSELWGTQCVRLKVTTKTENCGENSDCSGKGICFSNYDMEEYECQCCSGFAGPHCEEIDACTPSPCTNNGICVDLSQGHEGNSYQCLCPYGYTGKNCQYELDPCNPAECMNGGSCVGNSTHFRCDCTPGYTGPLCQHSLNECESSPCVHGICVDQEDGFRCFCQPGFAGELCNFEYNECESNPCQNGGECIDHIGSFECHCSKGYTGNRCQIKVDFCVNKPCPEGRRCIDHGNEYSCECLGGRNGPDCNEMQRTQCNVNPCTHGGTCWSSGDSFYCACRPGYTGTMCEDEFVVETVVSSSEFMVDDTSARNFNDKSFGSSVVLKSPIELHNAYTAAIVLALVIFFVALYLTICHCKVNQTYRKFSTRTYGFLPILGFRLRTKQATSKISKHWLSGKGLGIGNPMRGGDVGGTTSSSSTSALQATTATSTQQRNNVGHLPTAKASSGTKKHTHVGQLNERPFQRHLAMNLENDMYYTVDFSENSPHSPLIQ